MEDYTTREITEKFNDIKEMLERIEKQTTRTNGRVSKLENWRAYLLGGFAMVTVFLISIFIPVMDALIRSGKIF